MLPFIVTRRAWAGVAQPGKTPVAMVSVFPFDLDAGAAGLIDAHLGWSLCVDRKLRLRRLRPARLFLGNEAYSLVTHLYSVYRPERFPML
jgi:hypothetical protein